MDQKPDQSICYVQEAHLTKKQNKTKWPKKKKKQKLKHGKRYSKLLESNSNINNSNSK